MRRLVALVQAPEASTASGGKRTALQRDGAHAPPADDAEAHAAVGAIARRMPAPRGARKPVPLAQASAEIGDAEFRAVDRVIRATR